jgi:hypothetical protein
VTEVISKRKTKDNYQKGGGMLVSRIDISDEGEITLEH